MGDVLSGKVAIVTGGAGGIGAETARALCEAGARVVVADLRGDLAHAVAEALRADGHEAAGHEVDITSEDSVKALVAATVATFGGLDVLDNNAGATGFSHRDTNVVDMTVELWDQVAAINARGAMLTCKHAIPHMLAAGGGSIVNISSGQSLVGDLANVAYAASKAAVNAMSRHIATVYGHQGIRCNVVAPGLIVRPGAEDRLPPAVVETFIDHALVPRLGMPRDIANMVVFLASDLAAYVTGQVISVDGGVLTPLSTVPAMRRLAAGYTR